MKLRGGQRRREKVVEKEAATEERGRVQFGSKNSVVRKKVRCECRRVAVRGNGCGETGWDGEEEEAAAAGWYCWLEVKVRQGKGW